MRKDAAEEFEIDQWTRGCGEGGADSGTMQRVVRG